MARGRVIKLDRGYPLVKVGQMDPFRCEHSTALVKSERVRSVIGDFVDVALPHGHDNGIILSIEPRSSQFVRRDPAERTSSQVLAANFERVIVVEPAVDLNVKRLERELVLAHEAGVAVSVLLTKADLVSDAAELAAVEQRVRDLAGRSVEVLSMSTERPETVEAVRAWIPEGTLSVLLGKSGVGKSSLVNLLAGKHVMETGSVREGDGKGRHTTVSRAIVPIPGAGDVVDMPGVRGLGLWDADEGIEAAFPDVAAFSSQCRFRDCRHEAEPGCAVRAAVERGELASVRVESYRALKDEVDQMRRKREEARQMRGEKASDQRDSRKGAFRARSRYNRGSARR